MPEPGLEPEPEPAASIIEDLMHAGVLAAEVAALTGAAGGARVRADVARAGRTQRGTAATFPPWPH